MMQSLPLGQSSLIGAGLWLQHLLLGGLATSVAVLAIAVAGTAMLTGRIDIRRGSTVILGCFLLFGAPTIATGLRNVLGTNGAIAENTPSPATKLPSMPPSTNPFDPYAGATVPQLH